MNKEQEQGIKFLLGPLIPIPILAMIIYFLAGFSNSLNTEEKIEGVDTNLNLNIMEGMDESDIALNHNYSEGETTIKDGVVAYTELITFDTVQDAVSRGDSDGTFDISYQDREGNERYLQDEFYLHYNQGNDKKEKFIVDGNGEYHLWLLRERQSESSE